jgi:hypothetical protein
MKAVLIVLFTFHYDGGSHSLTATFDNMRLCEAARAKLQQQDMRPDGWGRPRLIAVCSEQKS